MLRNSAKIDFMHIKFNNVTFYIYATYQSFIHIEYNYAVIYKAKNFVFPRERYYRFIEYIEFVLYRYYG